MPDDSPPGTPQDHLLLFARLPAPGSSKTRLIPRLGEHGSAAFARAALLDILHLFAKLPVRNTWFYTPETAGREVWALLEAEGLTAAWHAEPQTPGPDLGSRLAKAFQWAKSTSPTAADDPTPTSTTFIGMDCFDLTPELVMNAVSSSVSNAAQVMPARDGGYVLLTLPMSCSPAVFEHVPWSCARTCEVQMSRVKDQGYIVQVWETLGDVDDPSDLDRLWHNRTQWRDSHPRTMECLQSLMEKSTD